MCTRDSLANPAPSIVNSNPEAVEDLCTAVTRSPPASPVTRKSRSARVCSPATTRTFQAPGRDTRVKPEIGSREAKHSDETAGRSRYTASSATLPSGDSHSTLNSSPAVSRWARNHAKASRSAMSNAAAALGVEQEFWSTVRVTTTLETLTAKEGDVRRHHKRDARARTMPLLLSAGPARTYNP